MFGLFKNRKTKPETDVADEILKHQAMLLAKKISLRNGEGDITEDSEAQQIFYTTHYLSQWFVRWSIFESRQGTEKNLAPSEIGPSLMVLDTFLFNISSRYGHSKEDLAQQWDFSITYFLREFCEAGNKEYKKSALQEKYQGEILSVISVLKTMERLTPSAVADLRNRVNLVVLEAIDVFVLEEKENCRDSFKNLYFLWASLIENYENLAASSQ